tara:strand:+ start:60 stop:791 length:732 start_codon:yes stop_codon:yes gene_type:complete
MRTKRPSEQPGQYTQARYEAWDRANKKRAENNTKITHGIVYKLTSPSGKAYVGISKYAIERRILWHKSNASCCNAIKAALKKYGFANFTKEILHANIPLAELGDLEIKEIAAHGTLQPKGYNLTKGGEYNPMDMPSSRKKVSDAKTQYWQDSGQSGRDAAAAKMQEGDARARATETKLRRSMERWEAKAAGMSPAAGKRFIQDKLKERERRQERYREQRAFLANSYALPEPREGAVSPSLQWD